jgi:NADPH:quinone reductase-like Zn-dependent oxidoreductase
LAKHLGATVVKTASENSFAMLKDLGADILIDYKKEDFETILKDYDVVLNRLDAKTLEKSIHILKPGGKTISISRPPTPDFAKAIGAPWFVKIILSLISSGIRRKAKKLALAYSFLFMKTDGRQSHEISKLIEKGSV